MITHNNITINRKTRTITHAGKSRFFPSRADVNNIGFQLMEMLILAPHGASPEMLFKRIYGEFPENGPISGPHALLTRFNQMKDDFAYLRLKLVSDRRASVTYYKLVPINQGDYDDAHEGIPVHIGRTHTQNLVGS